MIPVLQVPISEDLTEFTQFLWANEVPHRVTEEEHTQTLWVSRQVSTQRVRELYEYWRNGGSLSAVRVAQRGRSAAPFSPQQLLRVPVVSTLILLSVLASLLIGFGSNQHWLERLSFSQFVIQGDQLYYDDLLAMLQGGELWRIWTPIFLHFSLLHILFNLLWVWIIGRRLEQLQGGWQLILLVAFSGALSNFGQYLLSGPLFGGMSGVVFALLSYTWLWDRVAGRPVFGFPPMLMGFMLFWLALGYSGALEVMGMGAIANTAHLLGLISGLIFVPITRLWRR